ncbi:MAG: VOC family protein [Gammaproteobacteria bacterium]|nr:VOC family protein [Gammaproteobacteria bacterium]
MDMKRITEIGVAVHDLEQATTLLVELFNATAGEVMTVEMYQMRFRMCRVGKVDFELMEPLGDSGVIADFLRKRGEGLHHIAFAVDDIETAMGELQGKGVTFVDDKPLVNELAVVDYAGRAFRDDLKFAFSQPRSILGILFEFIQYPEGYQTP